MLSRATEFSAAASYTTAPQPKQGGPATWSQHVACQLSTRHRAWGHLAWLFCPSSMCSTDLSISVLSSNHGPLDTLTVV